MTVPISGTRRSTGPARAHLRNPVQKPYGFGIGGVETQKHGSRMRINSPGRALSYGTDRIDAFLPFRQCLLCSAKAINTACSQR